MSAAVFVYNDGTVGQRDLPPEHAVLPTYLLPVMRPCVTKVGAPMPNLEHRRFDRVDRMFDGRPIFVERPRWRAVRRAHMEIIYPAQDSEERIILGCRDSLRRMTAKHLPMDEQIFRWSEPEHAAKGVDVHWLVAEPADGSG